MMNIALLVQEEPVYMGPMLIDFMEKEHERIKLVAVAPLRGAGNRKDSFVHSLEDYLSTILIFGVTGVAYGLLHRCIYATRNLHDDNNDCYSIAKASKRLSIPLIYFNNIKDEKLIHKLKELSFDIMLNQTDQYIPKEVLDIPNIGVINRHGSLLPKHRGRLASFWSHLEGEYGVTIHYVSEEIDAGNIIYQEKLNLDPKESYHQIIKEIFESSGNIISTALQKIEDPKFNPISQSGKATTHTFPKLRDAINYRKILKARRNYESS